MSSIFALLLLGAVAVILPLGIRRSLARNEDWVIGTGATLLGAIAMLDASLLRPYRWHSVATAAAALALCATSAALLLADQHEERARTNRRILYFLVPLSFFFGAILLVSVYLATHHRAA